MLWIFLVHGGLQQWHQILILKSLLCVPFTRGWTVKFWKYFASSSVKFSLHSPATFRSQRLLGNSTRLFRRACLRNKDSCPVLPDKGMLRYNIRDLNFSQRFCWRCKSYGILRCVDLCTIEIKFIYALINYFVVQFIHVPFSEILGHTSLYYFV
jgi:hypothetical protein